jgi:hypothetical protein
VSAARLAELILERIWSATNLDVWLRSSLGMETLEPIN